MSQTHIRYIFVNSGGFAFWSIQIAANLNIHGIALHWIALRLKRHDSNMLQCPAVV